MHRRGFGASSLVPESEWKLSPFLLINVGDAELSVLLDTRPATLPCVCEDTVLNSSGKKKKLKSYRYISFNPSFRCVSVHKSKFCLSSSNVTNPSHNQNSSLTSHKEMHTFSLRFSVFNSLNFSRFKR